MAVPRTTTLLAAAAIALTLADIGVAIGRSASSGSPSSAASTPPAIPVSPLAPASPPASPAPPRTTGPATPTATPAPNSFAGQLAKTFQLALAQHTVHSVAKNVSKKGTATFDDYDGVQTGEQHIAINGGHVDVRVIGPTTYFTGDAKGLAIYGFTPQAVQALHGQWLSLVAGQPGYRIITAGVTISSTLKADAITGPLTRKPAKTLDGVKVYGIAGTGSGPGSPRGSHATLWISEQTGLPVAFDATNRTTTITETFSDWGKPIHVATPADVYGQPGLAS